MAAKPSPTAIQQTKTIITKTPVTPQQQQQPINAIQQIGNKQIVIRQQTPKTTTVAVKPQSPKPVIQKVIFVFSKN